MPESIAPEEAHPGNTKVTREDWVNAARDLLVSEGVGEVKILALGTRLNVSRSSFYWYFKSRRELLDALLDGWEQRNTRTIVEKCSQPSATITEGVCNFFRCFIDPTLFDQGLDFAVREWSRRDAEVRARIDAADATRLAAVTDMFARHGYDPADADARARILYYMQLGYHALEVREDMETRLGRVAAYTEGFIGAKPDHTAIAELSAFARGIDPRD